MLRPSVGTRLSQRYVVLKALGEGGMGVVVAAFDERLNRSEVLKRVHPRWSRCLAGCLPRAWIPLTLVYTEQFHFGFH
jgi:hypothetical protein